MNKTQTYQQETYQEICTFQTGNYSVHSIFLNPTYALTVINVESIPIGKSANLSQTTLGKIYVPTKWGGSLELSGSEVQLFYTDGSDLNDTTVVKIINGELDSSRIAQGSPCQYDVPENQHGWYYVKIIEASLTEISSDFRQVASANTRPWNGWYWPKLDSENPNLYDSTGAYTPLKDYDTVYGSTTRATEEFNYSGGTAAWHGHCWGWNLAAIAKTQPVATTKNGVSFNQDEMEGLYTELAEGATAGWTWRVGHPNAPIPAEPCTYATGEDIDAWADDIHKALRIYIKEQGKAMNGNLRNSSGNFPDEVWNHDIYEYEWQMEETDAGNKKIVLIMLSLSSNDDVSVALPDSSSRGDAHFYILEYKDDGTIDGTSAEQNWCTSSGFPPKCLGTVEGPLNWIGKHSGITKPQVDGLYQ